jgi:hypothetical protein
LPEDHRGVAQLGSARRSGRRGRRFKSCHPDEMEPPCSGRLRFFLLASRRPVL